MMQRNEITEIRRRVLALGVLTAATALLTARINPLGVALAYLALLVSVEVAGLIMGLLGGLVASAITMFVIVFVNQYVSIALRESTFVNVAAELAAYGLAGPLAGWVGKAIARAQQRADYWRARAEQQTVHDETLGTLKPGWALVRLDEELLRAARFERPLSVVLARLVPHPQTAGDRVPLVGVMRAAIRIAQVATKAPAVVAHAGGGRLMLILPEVTVDEAQKIVEHLQQCWSQEPYFPEDQDHGLGQPLDGWGILRAQVGSASSPTETAEAVLARLDAML